MAPTGKDQARHRWLRRFVITPLALLAVTLASAAQAEFTATVDRTSVTELDLVTLAVRLNNETTSSSPDFSGINQDFVVVGQTGPNRSSRFVFSNGKQITESHTEWGLTLRPRRTGNLTIPAIQLGNRSTAPIQVQVSKASAAMTQRMNQFVFFDTSVDTNSTYVQGQVIYTVKLFYVDSISGDFPPPPPLADTVIETIESEKRYESIVNNRRFYVLEKRYAIYPQKSGTLTIPRENFTGTRGTRRLFSAREPVGAVSESHTIEVKPRPASFTGEHWLPARNITIEESWSTQRPRFRVGEPVNRTIKIMADGLASSLLPPLDELNIENAKSYQDPPTTEDLPLDDGVLSTRQTTVGIVPTKAGKLTLPSIRIPWWNTDTDELEIAEIPAQTFDVEPGTGVSVGVPTQQRPATAPVTAGEVPAPVVQTVQSNLWLYVTITVTLLWLFTLWLWWTTRQRLAGLLTAVAPDDEIDLSVNEAEAFKRLEKACKQSDAAATRNALFLWGSARYPGITSLADLATRCEHEGLSVAITDLEMSLYAPHASEGWRPDALLAAVKALRKAKPERARKQALASELNPA